jgi:hypothetical protein
LPLFHPLLLPLTLDFTNRITSNKKHKKNSHPPASTPTNFFRKQKKHYKPPPLLPPPEPQRFLFFTPISETFRAMRAKTETERWGTREVQKEK